MPANLGLGGGDEVDSDGKVKKSQKSVFVS